MCVWITQINAQTYTMQYTDYKVFDSIKEQSSFGKKIKTNVMIDYNVKVIVISQDTIQRFLTIISNYKVDEDIFFDCKDKNDRSYKLSMLTTPTHYVFVEALEKDIKTYRVLKN